MEEKKCTKISASTFLLIITIIALGVMGFFLYKINDEKVKATEQVSELKNTINQLENNTNELKQQISQISNNTSNINNTITNTTTSSKYSEITEELDGIDALFVTNVVNNNDNTYTLEGVIYSQYTLTQEEFDKIIKVGSMIVDSNTYTVQINEETKEYCLYKNGNPLYTIKKSNSSNYYLQRLAQVSNVWKLTNKYKTITVDKNVKCIDDYSDGETTIEKQFENFKSTTPIDTTNPIPSYTFKFENDKCTKVIVHNGI